MHSIPVLTREYLLPPQWVPRPLPYLFTVFTLHQSMAQNLFDINDFLFEIGVVQLRSVAEIARHHNRSTVVLRDVLVGTGIS